MEESRNDKQTIVHVIDDLGRGGAETLLVDLLKELQIRYNIILVTLTSYSEFDEKEITCQYRYSLGYNSKLKLPIAIYKLKKIIKKHKPVLVRSQLIWSTIIARMACPKKIPFVFSVHVTLSDGAFKFTKKGIILKWLEKLTYKSYQTMIGVTEQVVKDYNNAIGLKGKHYVLSNYVNDEYFINQVEYIFPQNGTLKIVAVGNPKKQKNYNLLLNAFKLLKGEQIVCDIYGKGYLNPHLQDEINEHSLPVSLKGKASDIACRLKEYDLYIMCSLFEGFGIAVAEAMAVGLPVLLSDLPVLREVSKLNAVFFNPKDEKELAQKILAFKEGKYDVLAMSKCGKAISKTHYSKEEYVKKLLAIYKDCQTKEI